MSNTLPKYENWTEIEKIFNTIPEHKIRDRLIFSLMSDSGLRISEPIKLKEAHINTTERLILIEKGKGDKSRYVPISNRTIALFERYMSLSNISNDYIILTKDGQPFKDTRYIRELIRKYSLKALGRSINPHKIRHSFAVHFLKSGGNIKNLQKILGHTSLKNTAVYLDLLLEDVKDDYNKIFNQGAEQ